MVGAWYRRALRGSRPSPAFAPACTAPLRAAPALPRRAHRPPPFRPQAILDSILENLVEPRKTERPTSHTMAQTLIKRCVKQLAQPILDFLANCFTTSSAAAIESELREDWPQARVPPSLALRPRAASRITPPVELLSARAGLA